MRDQSQKLDRGKGNPLMIYEDLGLALKIVQATLEYGREKYGARGGWKQVYIQRYKEAEARHYQERMLASEGILARDEESGLVHIAHQIVDGLFQLQTLAEKKSDTDFTIYKKPVPVAEILAKDNVPTTSGENKIPNRPGLGAFHDASTERPRMPTIVDVT